MNTARRGGTVWLLVPLLALLAAGWGVAHWLWGPPSTAPLPFHVVEAMNLDVTVVKDGELQAVRNIEIVSRVEGRNTIQEIVEEGSSVKQGDVLVVLDSSEIQQRLEEVILELQRAEADLVTERERHDIQISQNTARLEDARVALTLARLEWRKYTEGTYPQQLEEAHRTLRMAEINLANKEDDYDQTRRLFERGYVPTAEVKKAQLEVMTARNELNKRRIELQVLTQWTHERERTDKQNKLEQAKRKLDQTRRENASELAQRVAAVRSAEQTLANRQRRVDHLTEQYENCTIRAPADGLVVYGPPSWMHGQRTPIQEGTELWDRQLILRLPDTRAMKVEVRLQENQMSQLTVGMPARVRVVGHPEPLAATVSRISVLPDSGSQWWNPDLREYTIDLTLDETPASLRPSVRAEAEIFVRRLRDVTAVPLGALYTVGEASYVFLAQGDRAEPRRVTLGPGDPTHIQVTEGLEPGERIVLLQAGQGRELLETAGMTARAR